MHLNVHLLLHRIFKIRSELQEIYFNQIIQTFAISLIGIFIPIYLLKLGFGLDTVLFYVLLVFATMGLISPLSALIASRIGLKHTILFRFPISIVFFFLLILLGFSPLFPYLLGIAVIEGLSFAVYWIPLNSEFLKHSNKLHAGEETGRLIALPKLAGVVGPVAGALILDYLGFNPLFLLVILLLFISVLPLFATMDIRKPFGFRLRDLNPFMDRRYAVKFFCRGVFYMAEMIIWPIYVFLTLNNFISVGVMASLFGMGIGFSTLLAGKISDRVNRAKMLKVGAFGYASVWFARLFAISPLEIFLLSFLGGMFMAVVIVNIFSSFCNLFRSKNVLGSVVFREIWITLGRVVTLFILILVLAKFQTAFMLAGLLCLLLVLV